MTITGAPINRVDAWAKVSGAARYSAEHPVADVAHAVLVTSTIPSGRVLAIDDSAAREVPGVLFVMTHENALRLPPKSPPSRYRTPTGLSIRTPVCPTLA